jgi:hypothetical protein
MHAYRLDISITNSWCLCSRHMCTNSAMISRCDFSAFSFLMTGCQCLIKVVYAVALGVYGDDLATIVCYTCCLAELHVVRPVKF